MLSTKDKIKSIVIGSSIGVLFGTWVVIAGNLMNMPDVLVSNSTGECVEVFNYDEDDHYTCQNPPKRYNHIWVR